MNKENIDFLIFLDENISDKELYLEKHFIPELIKSSLAPEFPDSKIFFSAPAEYSGKLRDYPEILIRNGADDLQFWKNLFEKTGSSHISLIKADSPFIDPEIIKEICELHKTYLAEFLPFYHLVLLL